MIQTILLPTDFSVTATNAGLYAVELAKQIGAKRIVVYHSYDAASVSEPFKDYTQKIVTEPFRQKSAAQLNEYVAFLSSKKSYSVEIEAYHSHADLTVAVNELVKTTGAELIVMGITGGGKVKEALIGSHSISVAKKSDIPVIIVPTEYSFTTIEDILFVSDLKDVENTTPVDSIKDILNVTKAKLHILHVTDNTEKAENSEDKHTLEKLFSDYRPDFHFMNNPDFVGAVDFFVKDKKIEIVIVVPKKHGLLESIFSTSYTKTLAFRGKTPLMAVRNTDK
ncbi:MAG: universal stress protein [Chitinophagaceae bacterium]|nr:universal stress protein [Chitinophagaceae bacterium]MCW5906043.1 universal stress protein [Chitinophagaceae bacterium]